MSALQTSHPGGPIPPEVRRELERELQLLLEQEQEPVTTDVQEYRVLVRLLEDARTGGATPVNGQIQRFRPGQPVDYENEGVLEQTTERPTMPPALRLALIGVAVFGIFAVLALNTVFAAPQASRATISTATAVPPTPTQEPLGAVRIGSSSLPPVYPNALGIGERQWLINVAPVAQGNWNVAEEANTANWLPGSVVNWSFGLWDDPEAANRRVFSGIEKGATATLWLSSGAVRQFRLEARQEVPRPQITVLGQRSPGLTIILIGGDPGANRLVVRGVEIDIRAEQPATQTMATPLP